MAYTNPKLLLEEIAFARKQYEKSLEAGDSAAADKHFSRVMDLKEHLAGVEKANDQHNLRYGTQQTIDDIKQKAAIRELRIQLGQPEGEAPQSKTKITGAGFRKPKGGGAPAFVPFDVLKANAEAAKAKLAAEKAALGETPKPKLATDGLDLIRQAKEKKFGRVEPSNVPPKSNTANIVPRQEAIDEARQLEENARLKAIADKQAYDERQLEKAASKKLLEERRADAAAQKEAKKNAAAGEAPTSQRTPRQIAAATPTEILGNYEPKLAQPAAAPIDTSASLREAEVADEKSAEKERLIREKEKQKINGRHVSNYGTDTLEIMDKSAPEKIATPKRKKGESQESWDSRLKEWGDATDAQTEKRQLVRDELARRSGNTATREMQLAVDKELKAQAKIKANADMVEALKRKGLGMADSLDDAAPTSNTSTLGRPAPAPLAAPASAPIVDIDPAAADKAAKRAALLAQLQELDAPSTPPLAAPTVTVTTPEGLKITKPATPAAPAAPAGLTPEQLASLAEAEEFDKSRGQRPQQKGRVDNTPKPSGNPARQTPSAGQGRGGALGGGSGPGSGGMPPSAALGFGGLVFGMSMKDLNAAMAEAGEDVAGRTASQRDPVSNNQAQREISQKYLEKKALEQSLRPPTKRGLEPINWDGTMLFRKMQGGD